VHHVGVVEAADHVHDRVHLADVRQELVAEPLTLGRALDEARDVHELDHRRTFFFGLTSRFRRSSRASGTSTTPTLGSTVQKG